MLAAEPNSFELREPPSYQGPESIDEPDMAIQKQVTKKPLITPFRIMLGLAVFFLLIVGSFKLYTLVSPPVTQSGLENSRANIREHADSSSQNGKGSSTGSSSSRGGRNSDKAKEGSKPAGKTVIANTNDTGESGSGGDGEDNDDGDKNKKALDKDKNSETGKSKGETTTDDDEDESIEEDSDDLTAHGLMWPNRNEDGPTPLIGEVRK